MNATIATVGIETQAGWMQTVRHLWRTRWPGMALLLALLLIGGRQVWYCVALVQTGATVTTRSRAPFRTALSPVITTVQPEGAAAGLRPGDIVERIEGRPFTGPPVLSDAVHARPVGGQLTLQARRPNGEPYNATVRLSVVRARPLDASTWLVLILVDILVPTLCLGLCFAAVALRIRSPLAWLLLALMVSFSQMLVEPVASFGSARIVQLTYTSLAEKTFGIWVLLFALSFTGRDCRKRLVGRVAWVVIALLAGVGAVRTVWDVARQTSFRVATSIAPYDSPSRAMFLALTALSVLLFIALFAAQARGGRTAEEARRVRILMAGSLLGFGPFLVLLAISAIRHTGALQGAPLWVSMVSVLAIAIFPVTVLYLVLAPQVLEIRVLIREGLLQACARSGVLALRRGLLAVCAVGAFVLAGRGTAPGAAELTALAYGLALVLLLQPELAERAIQWVDGKLFPAAHGRQVALAATLENIWSPKSVEDLASTAASALLRTMGVSRVTVLLASDGAFVSAADLGPASSVAPAAIPVAITNALPSTVKPGLVYQDDPASWIRSLSPEPRTALATLQTRVLVPVPLRGVVTALISLGPKLPDRGFSASEMRGLAELARQFAVGYENAQLLTSLQSEATQRERLKFEREAADQANQAKSTFLANMSHELRTPLNAILGYTEILRETAEDMNDESMMKDLDRIHSAGRHLLTLINSVLDISKIEAGKMDVCMEPVDIAKLVFDVSPIAKPGVEKNGNRFVCQVAPDLAPMQTDPTKLRQVLLNLLSNAGKFTSNGTVTLDVREEDRDGAPYILFAVRDTGIGLTKEQMGKLFQPFVQATSTTSRKYGGTGLGLALSRRFCQLMGGDIDLDSTIGEGTVFTVWLPAGRPKPAAPRLDDVAAAAGVVLVVDDDPDVHELLRRHFQRDGRQMVSAYNVKDGLEKAKAIQPGVITLDVSMPGADGWQMLTALRADPALAQIPVIMISGEDNRGVAFSLGANAYLQKPIDRGRLSEILSRYSLKGAAVLVVDDDEVNRRTLRSALEAGGVRAIEACNGREAIGRLRETDVRLVLLDLVMPDMDGFEFVAEIRKYPQWAGLPIVVITSKDLTEEERVLLNGRVEGIVQKASMDREALVAEVARRVSGRLGLNEEESCIRC